MNVLNQTIEIDWTYDVEPSTEAIELEIKDILHSVAAMNVQFKIVTLDGPSGWPVIHLTGPSEELQKFLYEYSDEEIETFLI